MKRDKTKIKARLLAIWCILLSGLFSGKVKISGDQFTRIYYTLCTIACYLTIMLLVIYIDTIERE